MAAAISSGVFCKKPAQLTIYESGVTNFSKSQKIDTLIQELMTKGPMVALAQLGPSHYREAPFKLKDKVGGHEVYGWKKGAVRKEGDSNYLMVLGAQKVGDKSFVYYTISKDHTPNSKDFIRTHRPEDQVFVSSFDTFRGHLVDLYPPPNVNEEKKGAAISDETYIKELMAMDPKSIIDRGAGEKACKAIGQKIFDAFFKAHGQSAAEAAVRRICEALKAKKPYVERAWDGIGNTQYQWRA